MIGGGLSQPGRECHRRCGASARVFRARVGRVQGSDFAVPLRSGGRTCQSTGTLAGRSHNLLLSALTGATLGISGFDALAAPFSGTGHAAIGGDTDGLKARNVALERARKAALETAIEQIGGADPAARKGVLGRPAEWTGSYRVLQQADDGATATAVVSVEIDTARLAKALAAPGAGTASAGLPPLLPSLTVELDGCPAAIEAGLRRGLIAAGVVRDVAPGSAGPVLAARLQCGAAGLVRYPRQAVLRVEARWTGGPRGLPERVIGVGEDPAAAADDAAAGLAGRAAAVLSGGTGAGVSLRLSAPWPAARVRRLERALRESVVGVQAVAVAGVSSDGSVVLRVEGSLTAEELHAKLPGVTVPGATLVVGEVDKSHVVHASLQASSRPSAE
jgi:hypothetical protein